MNAPSVPCLDVLLQLLDRQVPYIEKSLARLTEEQVWTRPRATMNSIGNLCLHLAGNESHYLGHLIGGSDYRRDRSGEFDARGGFSKAELLARLAAARASTRALLATLEESDLSRPVEADHPERATVLRLVGHVVEHYAYHTGQIVVLARQLQEGEDRILPWGH